MYTVTFLQSVATLSYSQTNTFLSACLVFYFSPFRVRGDLWETRTCLYHETNNRKTGLDNRLARTAPPPPPPPLSITQLNRLARTPHPLFLTLLMWSKQDPVGTTLLHVSDFVLLFISSLSDSAAKCVCVLFVYSKICFFCDVFI